MATTKAAAEAKDSGAVKDGHVVLTDVLVYKTKGRKPNSVVGVRARKGAFVTLDPELTDIDQLIEWKAVAVNDGEPKRRTSPVALTQAQGAFDDPVRKSTNLFDLGAESVVADVPDAGLTGGGDEDNDDEPEYAGTPADDDTE